MAGGDSGKTGEREVRLPALTTTMEEAELVEWRVAVGDEVSEGQPLGEIVTDKVDMPLESPFDGTVSALLVEAGTVVRVGVPVARIATDSDDLLGGLGLEAGDADTDTDAGAGAGDTDAGAGAGDADAGAGAGDADAGTGADAGAADGAVDAGTDADAGAADGAVDAGTDADAGAADGAAATTGPSAVGDAGAGDDGTPRVPAPPPVRLRAREAGVDLADVPATGGRGQVTTDDLQRYLDQRERPDGAAVKAQRPPSRPPSKGTGPPLTAADRRRAALRAATARVVTRSAAIPQFTLHRALDLSRAVEHKQGRSWTTEIVRALAAALRGHPELNGRWNDDEQRVDMVDGVRIGVAVAVPAGLVVVGLDDPDQITATHADEHVRQIVARAREGNLDAADVEGITFTVSNLGGMGVDAFDALVMPPQAGILSVGRVVERPVVAAGRVRPQLQVDVGLTVDHRVGDGADGARLLDTFAGLLEPGLPER